MNRNGLIAALGMLLVLLIVLAISAAHGFMNTPVPWS